MTKKIRALAVLGYSFPEDKSHLVGTLRQLPLETLSELRSAYKHEYEFGLAQMNNIIDSVEFHTCGVCEREASGYGELPELWGYYHSAVGPYIMCERCQFRFTEKYNQSPEISREL